MNTRCNHTGWIVLGLVALLGYSEAATAQIRGPHEKRVDEVKKLSKEGTVTAVSKIIPFLRDKHPFPSDEAFKQLSRLKNSEAIAYLCEKALFDKNVDTRADLIEVLEQLSDERAVGPLLKLLKTDKNNQALIIHCLATLEAKQAIDPCLKFKHFKAPTARAEAVALVLKLAPHLHKEVVPGALRDKTVPVQIAALRALPDVDADLAFAEAKRILEARVAKLPKDRSPWQPIVMAHRIVRRIDDRGARTAELKEVVDLLIALLKPEQGEKGRMHHEAGLSLQNLTGVNDIGDDYHAWKAFWQARRDTFTFPKKPLPKSTNDDKDDDEDAGESATQARYTFHGIPIHSNRVNFIIDLSGSMDDNMPMPGGGERCKLDVSKEELLKTVGQLDTQVWFNVVIFGTKISTWQPQIVCATESNKRKARQYVAGLNIEGRTDFYGALKTAATDPNVDTVYFLTDGGVATEGRYIELSRVVRKALEIQRWNLVEINCLLFGTQAAQRRGSFQRRWLKDLANATGGRFYMRPKR